MGHHSYGNIRVRSPLQRSHFYWILLRRQEYYHLSYIVFNYSNFMIHGYSYNEAVVQERTGQPVAVYFAELIEFHKKNVTQTLINEDLNSLYLTSSFKR